MTRLATGIQEFDGMVQGGLPVGSTVLLQGPPGQEKLRFALTFLAEGLKAGASGLVVIASQSPDAVLAELRGLGVDLDAVTKNKRLRIVDWYSWSEEAVHDIEERGFVARSPVDLANLGVAMSRAMEALPGDQARRAVIELLSPATKVYEISQVYAFAQSAKKKFDRYEFTSLVLLEKDMHPAPELTTLHQPFDGVIEIERTRRGDRIVRKIGVLHLKETVPDPTFRVLEVAESGMRVIRDAPKPAPPASAALSAGRVLESQDERAHRLTLIMQIASERLRLNPLDTDALFAMAAAQATLDDSRGSLQSLERLSELDPKYPGLWVLKAKLHARLGEADRAWQSRIRSQQDESMEGESAEPTFPCPMCKAPLSAAATVCGNCGVKFAPAQKLKSPARTISSNDVAPSPKPTTKPIPKRGLTNGLALSRGAVRRLGMTNGLRGRTNGLKNGFDRTNGLTNGVGRTNGLTNGVGRTNGLTNGLGRTNGLTNGLGRTNGITNGLGRTNGLTNGIGGGRPSRFRSIGFRGMMRTAGWKLYVIPLVVVGLLLLPLFLVPDFNGPASPIRIDGQFGDWASVSTEAMGSGVGLNPNVDIVRFGVVDNLGPVAFYVQVAGTALQGGGASPGTMDSVRIFVDTDGSSATGYRIDGLGADRLIEVSGYAGLVRQNTLWEFDANRDTRDWRGWIKGTGTPAAATGSQIEAEAKWLAPIGPGIPVVATVHTASWDGQDDIGDFPISPSEGSLSVVADPQVPDVISGNGISLLRLTITGHGMAVSIDSLLVQIAGTAPPTAALSLRLTDGATVLDEVPPATRDVRFSFPARSIGDGATSTLFVEGDFSGTGGDTFGIRLPSAHPFGLAAGAVGVQENLTARLLGYLGSSPITPRVDGGFDEWSAVAADPANDVSPRANRNIDLLHEGAQSSGGSTFLYADVSGRILRGTSVPELAALTPVQGPTNTVDTDRDTVPDLMDPMALDFNNDGVPDTQTNGDYDDDGLVDYGFPSGTDSWLNTTLPGTFPAPYAGRDVSVYIGPTYKSPVLGEDVLRVFLDVDNGSWSGYAIGGIGADRLVEIRGKDGLTTQSALLAFSGSFPGEWAWNSMTPVTVALGHHEVEFSVSVNTTNAYVEAADFWGSIDPTTAVPARAPPTSSFEVAPSSIATEFANSGNPGTGSSRPPVEAMDISGNQQFYLTDTNHATEIACTTNKVASTTQGATPSATVTLNAGESGCWYVDATSGATIPAGSWESLLDISRTTALAVDAVSSTSGDTNPITWSHTTASQTDGLILVAIALAQETPDDTVVNSVTYGGLSLTKIRHDVATRDARTELWYRIGTLSGAQTVSITMDAANDVVAGAISFTGAHQTSPIGNHNGATNGGSSTASVTVTSATGEIVVDTVAVESAVTLTVGSGQTERWNMAEGPGGNTVTGGGSTEPGASSVTMSWSISTSTKGWSISAVSIKPAIPDYDVFLEIWNTATDSVSETIGTCLDATTYGDDVQCLISSVGAKTLTSDQVVRLRVRHSSNSGTVSIEYDDSDSTGNSRVTIPIPEFDELTLPVTLLVLCAAVGVWRRRRAARDRLRAPAEDRASIIRAFSKRG